MDGNIIKIRRIEIDRELSLLMDRVSALEVERGELDIAERVFERLSGAKRDSIGEKDQHHAQKAVTGATTAKPTVREMIKEALMDARQRGINGLTPKDMRQFIQHRFKVDVGPQVNTNAHRMFHELKEIEKDESGLYRLASKEKPADTTTLESQSAGLFPINPEHGREAGQGGGA